MQTYNASVLVLVLVVMTVCNAQRDRWQNGGGGFNGGGGRRGGGGGAGRESGTFDISYIY